MTNELLLLPTATNLGFCLKNSENVVVSQNSLCEKICGNQAGQMCSKLCSSLLEEIPPISQGMHLHKDQVIENDRVDVMIAKLAEQNMTLLYPLESQEVYLNKQADYFKSYRLTKSEISIMLMAMNGMTNAEIAEKLFVSRSTVKTHFNNIYRKLPASAKTSSRRGRKISS